MKREAGATYNRAKIWQISFFALNNTATNLYLFLMNYVTYYATGIVGLAVMMITTLLTLMRVFDGVTDPFIGFVIDRTNGKLGKFRPFMILGNCVLALCVIVMYSTTHKMPDGLKLPFFILIYLGYIIGYTFQTACTKAAQACLTNDPGQRPIFSFFDGIYNAVLFAVLAVFVSNYLVPKHGEMNLPFFQEFIAWIIIASAICTALAVVGIWSKDRNAFFGLGDNTVKIHFRDYVDVIRHNRGIQMLIVAASTDKLTMNVATNPTVMVLLFGMVMGNFAVYGQLSAWTLVPNTILLFLGVQFARKFGQKKALVGSTWLCIGFQAILFLLLWLGDPTTISFSELGIATLLFTAFYILLAGAKGIASSIVIPMIADCADFESYRSGRYVPGMMGTLFSFIDKLISSLSTTVIGAAVAVVGYTAAMPQPTDPSSPQIFWITMLLFAGLPILGWVASLVAMKFYPLDEKKMAEIQIRIREIKEAAVK